MPSGGSLGITNRFWQTFSPSNKVFSLNYTTLTLMTFKAYIDKTNQNSDLL